MSLIIVLHGCIAIDAPVGGPSHNAYQSDPGTRILIPQLFALHGCTGFEAPCAKHCIIKKAGTFTFYSGRIFLSTMPLYIHNWSNQLPGMHYDNYNGKSIGLEICLTLLFYNSSVFSQFGQYFWLAKSAEGMKAPVFPKFIVGYKMEQRNLSFSEGY